MKLLLPDDPAGEKSASDEQGTRAEGDQRSTARVGEDATRGDRGIRTSGASSSIGRASSITRSGFSGGSGGSGGGAARAGFSGGSGGGGGVARSGGSGGGSGGGGGGRAVIRDTVIASDGVAVNGDRAGVQKLDALLHDIHGDVVRLGDFLDVVVADSILTRNVVLVGVHVYVADDVLANIGVYVALLGLVLSNRRRGDHQRHRKHRRQ